MTRLVTFADVPSLSEQVATVRVVSTCDCGCASVKLRIEGPQVPATAVARLSDTKRDDYFAVSASCAATSASCCTSSAGSSESWRPSRAGRTGSRATRRRCDQHPSRMTSVLPPGRPGIVDNGQRHLSCKGHSAANSTSWTFGSGVSRSGSTEVRRVPVAASLQLWRALPGTRVTGSGVKRSPGYASTAAESSRHD